MAGNKAIPVMKYKTARPHIVTGDAILWKGNGIISRLIRLWTPYSHASLVVRLRVSEKLQERVFLVEALSTGLELRLLSKRLENYRGEAFWFHIDTTAEQKLSILEFALTKCASGIRYDFGSIIKNMLGRVSLDAHQYFCSEFVFHAWKQASLVSPHIAVAPRPGDLLGLLPGIITKIELYKG